MMLEVGLLDLRDKLIIHCLQAPLSSSGAAMLMQGFSFEWVAEKASFREASGLELLLRLFHAFPQERDLQLGMALVFRNVLGQAEENRKIILRAFDDPEVADRFLPSRQVRQGGSMELEREEEGEEEREGTEDVKDVARFLDWYHQEAQRQRRDNVVLRLERMCRAAESAKLRVVEKAAAKQSKYRKQIRDRDLKLAAVVQSALPQQDEKTRAKIRQSALAHELRMREIQESLQLKLASGERAWKELNAACSPAMRPCDATSEGT
eukprot:768796-Hanusia_phi.AAC.9